MDRIAFSTNKGRSFKAGGEGGNFYQLNMTAPKGQECRVIAIGGTHYDHMESLYAHYIRVEKISTDVNNRAETPRQSVNSIKNSTSEVSENHSD
jgi:hypothetical protein